MGSVRIPDNTANLINTNYQAPLQPLGTPTGVDQGPSTLTGVQGTKKPSVNLFATSSYQAAPKTVTLQDGSTINLPNAMPEDYANRQQELFGNIAVSQQQTVNDASSTLGSAIMRFYANPQANSDGSNSSNASQTLANMIHGHVRALKAGSGHSSSHNDSSSNSSSTIDTISGDSSASSATSPLSLHVALASKLAVGFDKAATGTGSVNSNTGTSAVSLSGPSTQASAPVVASGSAGFTINQSSPDLNSAVGSAVTAYSEASSGSSYDVTVQAVAYMGIQGIQQEMGQYASTMQTTINQQNTIRTDASELSQAVADWPTGTATQTFTFHNVDADGNMQTYTQSLSEDQAKAMSTTLQNTLGSLSDTTQMQQQQLQNMSQNYQEAVTTMSNLEAMQYQEVKNTLSNIKY